MKEHNVTPKVGDFVTVDESLIMSGYLLEINGDEAIVEIDNHTGHRIDSFKLSDLYVVGEARRYDIELTCWDYPGEREPYIDKPCVKGFCNEHEARAFMLACAIEEADSLNFEDVVEDGFQRKQFRINLEDPDYDAIINAWDGDDYDKVTGYRVVCVQDERERVNQKLKERHGCDLNNVFVDVVYEDEGIRYIFRCRNRDIDGEERYTADEAYKDADEFLHGVGVLW